MKMFDFALTCALATFFITACYAQEYVNEDGVLDAVGPPAIISPAPFAFAEQERPLRRRVSRRIKPRYSREVCASCANIPYARRVWWHPNGLQFLLCR
jgi:hypothetical protein